MLPVGDLGAKADGAGLHPGFHDPLQAVEGPAADEQDIGGVNGDQLLLGMLSSALGRNVGNSSLQDLKEGLLYAFAGNVPGNGDILALFGDLIDLIDIHDPVLRPAHIVVRRLDQL